MTSDVVQVSVKFVTIMQRYSGKGNREIQMELPPEPSRALDRIIEQFRIPWKGTLEKQARIFINGVVYDSFLESKEHLKEGDVIAFIPISGGG
jgi:molybdopterin converting factor small subunit